MTRVGRRGPRSGFRPDIEGLRAVAVLAVVLFHAAVPGVPGGFVGVDVFFVISGFLITGMLWRELERSGRVRLGPFYGARARRLLPAGMLVLVATAVGSAVLLPPLQARGVLGDAVASALYVGNYRLAVRGTDYLAANSPPSTFQHYWSLGVEEQFYLVWPALLILTAWLAHRAFRRGGDRGRPVAPYLLVLGVVAAASFAVELRWTTTLPPWAFFSLPTRAWQLAAGGLVALSGRWWARLPGPVAAASGVVGLGLVLFACVRFGSATPYPGAAALVPVLGAALIVGGGCAAPRWGIGRLLAVRPLRAIGRISYSWYLWHWPVLLLAVPLLDHPLTLPQRLLAAAVSGVLAVGTLVAVEDPVRFAGPLRRSAVRSLAVGAAATAVGLSVALVAVLLVPPAVGRGAAVAAPRIGATAGAADPALATVRDLTAQVQAAVAASAGHGAVPVNLTPSLDDAQDDVQQPWREGCVLDYTSTLGPSCVYGDAAGAITVALVGDSHAAMWQPALEGIAEQRHWRLDLYSKVLCPFVDLPVTSPYLGREYTECEQWRAGVLGELSTHPPAAVVLAAGHRYTADYGFTSFDPAWTAGLGRTVARLQGAGAQVLVLGPVPDPHGWVPTCLSEHLDDAAACAPSAQEGLHPPGIAAEQATTESAGGTYADLSELFCTTERCPVVVGNQLVFRDDNHLTPEYAALLAPVLTAELDRVLPGG
jgi:peptidoglycan/LPS O-acetylase OafA/YrhL